MDGVNNNNYQLEKLARYNAEARLDHLCRGIKGDFMKMPLADQSYDAAYAVEATCHAPDRVGVYSEIARVLKPGGCTSGASRTATMAATPRTAPSSATSSRATACPT